MSKEFILVLQLSVCSAKVHVLFGSILPTWFVVVQASESFTGSQPGYVFHMGDKGEEVHVHR